MNSQRLMEKWGKNPTCIICGKKIKKGRHMCRKCELRYEYFR